MRALIACALATLSVVALAACSSGASDAEPGQVRVVTEIEDPSSNAPFILAESRGYLREEGLSVKVAPVQTDPRSFLAGGSADVAVIDLPSVAIGIAQGLDLVIISGYRCREQFAFAVQSTIGGAADLNGRPVDLGGRPGVPIVDYRLSLLARAGWDLSKVSPDYVDVPAGGKQPTELFANKSLDLLNFYTSDLDGLKRANAKIIYDDYKQWPNEVLVTTRGWLSKNAKTAEGFLRAVMRATAAYLAQDTKQEFLDAARAAGYDMTDAGSYHTAGQYLYCANHYVNAGEYAEQLGALKVPNAPPFDRLTDTAALTAAQGALRLNNEPERASIPKPVEGR